MTVWQLQRACKQGQWEGFFPRAHLRGLAGMPPEMSSVNVGSLASCPLRPMPAKKLPCRCPSLAALLRPLPVLLVSSCAMVLPPDRMEPVMLSHLCPLHAECGLLALAGHSGVACQGGPLGPRAGKSSSRACRTFWQAPKKSDPAVRSCHVETAWWVVLATFVVCVCAT